MISQYFLGHEFLMIFHHFPYTYSKPTQKIHTMLSSLRIASQVARRSVGAAINHTTARFGSGLSFELSDEQQSMKVMIIVHFEGYINLKNPIWRLKEFFIPRSTRGIGCQGNTAIRTDASLKADFLLGVQKSLNFGSDNTAT